MTHDEFWKLLDDADGVALGSCARRRTALVERLRDATLRERQDFYRLSTKFYHESYDWKLWAAAGRLLAGGGDDGFMVKGEGWRVEKRTFSHQGDLSSSQSLSTPAPSTLNVRPG
jgi:hypothetical protein